MRHRRAARPPRQLTAAQVLALAPYAWYKAGDLALADGAAVGSWTDASGNAHTLTQSTTAKKPAYVASGLNGLPSVKFTTATATGLVVGLTPFPATVATIFVVGKAPTTNAATQYLVGTTLGTERRDVYYTTGRVFGFQGSLGFTDTHTTPGGKGFVVSAVVNGANSSIRTDSIPLAGTSSTGTNPQSITLGGRSTSVGSGNYDGHISEVIYFDKVLTPVQITAVERYLAAKYAVPLSQPNVYYVDGTNGDDTNNTGRSPSSPFLNVSKADGFLSAAGRIEVTGEVRQFYSFQTGTRQINLTNCSWYGSEKHTSGWTSMGGGVYSKTVTVFTTPYVRNTSDLDTDGYWTTLSQNTATPTTPAANQFGYVSGTTTLYVHLTGDADPNTKVIEVSRYDYPIHSRSSGDVVIRGDSGSKVLCSGRANVAAGASPYDGRVTCYDLESVYGGFSGCFATVSDATYFKRYRCQGHRAINDGGNWHGTAGRAVVVYSEDCNDHHNGDEGESAHDNVVHTIRGGWKHHNVGGGGITDIESSILDADGSAAGPLIVENNRLLAVVADEGGISVYDTTTTGTIGPNVISRNNNGPNLYVRPGSTGSTVAAAAKAASTGGARPDVTP